MYFFGITVISYSLITWGLSDSLISKMDGFLEQHKLVNAIERETSMILAGVQMSYAEIHGYNINILGTKPKEYLDWAFQETY